MLSQELKSRAIKVWDTAREQLGALGTALEAVIQEHKGETGILLRLLCGTLPALDLAQTPVEVLVSHARHSLMLRRESPFCQDVPEDIFIHYVLYPRINTEALTDCRPIFCNLVNHRVQGLTTLEAALELNLWCGEHMTYESTDDRTLDPLAAYGCGKGRCGEESTFAVSVLRSVGIPARQVYAIWWSHCDDNHAWVEFYDGNRWRYFGACEPEPVADRGWFTAASRRAMAICSRRFWDYRAEGMAREKILGMDGCCILDNQTGRYAKTLPVEVRFSGVGGTVRVFVLNMASLRLLTEISAGEDGTVVLELGQGTCLLEAELEGKFDWKVVTPEGSVLWIPEPRFAQPPEGQWEVDFVAPAAGGGNSPLTDAQTERRNRWLAQAEAGRRARQLEITPPADGAGLWDEKLSQSGENGKALLAFAQKHGENGRTLLSALSKKDWRDAPVAVLERFLLEAPGISPRIAHEKLDFWPETVKSHLPEFREPEVLWQTLGGKPTPCLRQYSALWPDPASALRLGLGDEKSRAAVFAAALRLSGIPVEPGTEAHRPRYLWQGQWQVPGRTEPVILELPGSRELTYGQSWTLSRWDCGWKLLSLSQRKDERYALPGGLYLLTVTTRLPDGTQLARLHIFRLQASLSIPLNRREASREQLLTRYPIGLADAGDVTLRLYLETGTEPGEHALNELLALADRLSRTPPLVLVVPDHDHWEHPTMKKVRSAFPYTRCQTADFQSPELENLFRSLYLEPGTWPLLLVTDGAVSYFCSCGYAVGAIPLALELVEEAEKIKG